MADQVRGAPAHLSRQLDGSRELWGADSRYGQSLLIVNGDAGIKPGSVCFDSLFSRAKTYPDFLMPDPCFTGTSRRFLPTAAENPIPVCNSNGYARLPGGAHSYRDLRIGRRFAF
jgi:hypothetical protein